MYVSTPYGRVVALDPTTGKELWVFRLPSGSPSTRGVEYWPGDARRSPRIVFGSGEGKLYSLDAKTGQLDPDFGEKGIVDLNTPEVLQGLPGNNGLSSPPVVYRNLVITAADPGRAALGPAGDVRAWDIHTGRLVWTFHSVPRAGEPFNDTWEGDSWKQRSGVNVWGLMTVDVQRGIVFMPFGAPATDRYGGDRPATISSARAALRPRRRRGSTCGTSRSCGMTSGTRTCRTRRCSLTCGRATVPSRPSP